MQRTFGYGLLGVVGLIGLVLLYHIDPFRFSILPPCALHETTGLYCLGCGGTRAFYLLLHGRVLESLRHNVLLLPILFGAAYAVLFFVLRPTRFRLAKPRLGGRGILVLAIGLVLFTIVRNIPVYPCTLLAPPEPPHSASYISSDSHIPEPSLRSINPFKYSGRILSAKM